ncbi:MAG: hypothetical protein XD54_2124 [Thermococcus sibiricus]|uniref:Uncharacterized protein n=1 Tax=Thermococcus sibiricus TaxID=172049 RepID=A0A101EJM1_9EURY|nr:MAG: hypothetical protein XD54_2124 [Thermococcus sibiricus]
MQALSSAWHSQQFAFINPLSNHGAPPTGLLLWFAVSFPHFVCFCSFAVFFHILYVASFGQSPLGVVALIVCSNLHLCFCICANSLPQPSLCNYLQSVCSVCSIFAIVFQVLPVFAAFATFFHILYYEICLISLENPHIQAVRAVNFLRLKLPKHEKRKTCPHPHHPENLKYHFTIFYIRK